MIEVHKVLRKEWSELARDAHVAVFGELPPMSQDHIDFALVAVDGPDLLGYVTCRDVDGEQVYWSYGGAFPPAKNTSRSWPAYSAMVAKCRALGYKAIYTFIENTNRTMLKFALKMGYTIVGMRTIAGSLMLEHRLELCEN